MTKAKNKRSSHRGKASRKSTVNNEATETTDVDMEETVDQKVERVSGKKLDTDDTRSVITNRMLRDLNLKKKDKLKMRKTVWKKRVNNAIEAKSKEIIKNKKKQQISSIVGDMSSILESLPIEVLLNKVSSHKKCKPERKAKGIESEFSRQQQKLSDISLFRSVLYHPEFKSNPLQTVTHHLRSKVEHENGGGV